jgi:hypothetical protein
MLGTTLVAVGLAGLAAKAWSVYRDKNDPLTAYSARVARVRLDTKKPDGREVYTYVLTFYIPEKNDYFSFKVSQKQFDETVEKDTGILKCHLRRRKFVKWTIAGQ